ncbi:phosphatidylinositol mannoside acyltransferase [Arcanobacterium bovis]|uniref:Phosphatidylinositol mannoside acyltransferase n=1 Tax=Arcanobacterium bovis TaxID=2529275 RepID=A0A4Q9V1A6_9ACTO|nr:phosphatidylinositol mannoside acyltransferase [Arcanobacterium bovis]TBW22874.1 phosphatidylinositol mannoside acyltransferase [Arcanobacterium bovis]
MDILRLVSLCDRFVAKVPDGVSRRVFEAVGFVVGLSNTGGVRQLRKNQQRIVTLDSKLAQRWRSAQAMRSYMRYYQEVFRLKYLSPEQIRARVSGENLDVLVDILSKNSCSGALLHSGNWDLAGAWATLDLAPVHTIAEKLEPPELAQQFLDFRESLGMSIYQAVRGSNSIGKLAADMDSAICFTPLLCDRDLSARGVEVELGGHRARVAPGAAILAIRTNLPMIPVMVVCDYFGKDRRRVKKAGSSWGIKLIIGEPILPPRHIPVGETIPAELLIEMNQQWMDQILPILRAHLTDWHMLQKLFVDDLDLARLQRALDAEPRDE